MGLIRFVGEGGKLPEIGNCRLGLGAKVLSPKAEGEHLIDV
jgi:hypothetical protein